MTTPIFERPCLPPRVGGLTLQLRPSFVNEVKGRFSRPPEAFEAASRHHFTHAFFPGLRTQGQPYFLRE
jgi:hypothetical protein